MGCTGFYHSGSVRSGTETRCSSAHLCCERARGVGVESTAPRGRGGIGIHSGLKIRRFSFRVRVPAPLPFLFRCSAEQRNCLTLRLLLTHDLHPCALTLTALRLLGRAAGESRASEEPSLALPMRRRRVPKMFHDQQRQRGFLQRFIWRRLWPKLALANAEAKTRRQMKCCRKPQRQYVPPLRQDGGIGKKGGGSANGRSPLLPSTTRSGASRKMARSFRHPGS